jgi:effector-binding domain-containing protein
MEGKNSLTLPSGKAATLSTQVSEGGGTVAELLSIGEFAKVSRLSIKALRLYDSLELLTPEVVDRASGYRYYAVAQAPRARAISLLRSVDMPLAAIKEVLAESDPDKIRAHLARHRAVLAARLDDHERMLQRVEHLIERGALVPLQVTVKEIPSTQVCGVEFQGSPEEIGPRADRAYARLFEALQKRGVTPAGPPRLAYVEAKKDPWTMEASVPVASAPDVEDDVVAREFPGGTVASALHRGPYEELGMAYRELGEWMRENGYESAGPCFDIYLNDPWTTEDPADYETEICWFIRPQSS